MPTCNTVRLIAGPRGTTGTPGTDGTDGVNAYTTLTANFTMPAELGTAVATVADTSWMTTGNTYYLQGAGWLQATAIGGATSVTLMNLEDAASDAYLANVAPGTIIALSSKLVAAGIQGPAGTDGAGGAPTDATYITQTPNGTLTNEQPLSGLATGLVKNTTATGVLSIVDIGVTDGSIPLINDAGGLTNGEAVFGTAAGIETKTAANARTALGLGTISTQASSNVNITGGVIVSTPISGAAGAFTTLQATGATSFAGNTGLGGRVFAQASTTQTLLAATAISPDAFRIKVAGSGGSVVLVATPTITPTGTDGQLLIIQGTSANTVTLQDSATLPGSQLELGAGTRVLGIGDIIVLVWDLATTSWYEISFANN